MSIQFDAVCEERGCMLVLECVVGFLKTWLQSPAYVARASADISCENFLTAEGCPRQDGAHSQGASLLHHHRRRSAAWFSSNCRFAAPRHFAWQFVNISTPAPLPSVEGWAWLHSPLGRCIGPTVVSARHRADQLGHRRQGYAAAHSLSRAARSAPVAMRSSFRLIL